MKKNNLQSGYLDELDLLYYEYLNDFFPIHNERMYDIKVFHRE